MDSTLFYILTIDNYPTIDSMIKKIENIFEYEIPFLQRVIIEKQKITTRQYLNSLGRVPSYLKMSVENFGSGDIIFEYYE